MAQPSDNDYRYLLIGANKLTDAIVGMKVSDALNIGCILFSRLSDDLKENARLRKAIDSGQNKLEASTRDAISRALEVFADRELAAFKKAGARPILVNAIQHDARYARMFLDLPNPDIELVRKKIQDLKKSVCDTETALNDHSKLGKLISKAKKVAYGGIVLYIDTATDLLGTGGLASSISVKIAVGILGNALEIPGFELPDHPDSLAV